jgi:hypothetical protein
MTLPPMTNCAEGPRGLGHEATTRDLRVPAGLADGHAAAATRAPTAGGAVVVVGGALVGPRRGR